MQTRDLDGAALCWVICQLDRHSIASYPLYITAEGFQYWPFQLRNTNTIGNVTLGPNRIWQPNMPDYLNGKVTDDIIDREVISTSAVYQHIELRDCDWKATIWKQSPTIYNQFHVDTWQVEGPTRRIAALRALVLKHYGEEVRIPKELS